MATTTQTLTNGASLTNSAPPPTTTTTTNPSSATYIPTGPVTAPLKFYSPPTDGSAPFNYVETPPPGHPQRNFTDAEHLVPIHDIRGHESTYNLDANAFAALTHLAPSATNPDLDFTDDAAIRKHYYPEIEHLLHAHLPTATRILLFDHTVRRALPSAPRAPVTRVHVDQTPASAAARVRHHIADPAEAERLLQGRYRIVNVWRPLNGAVQSFPLAFADAASVADEDLVGIEHRYPDRTGETAGVRWSERQRWFYWSGMTGGERLLLKCFDSEGGEGARGRAPHSAFVDPRTPMGARARESIEVRALVFG